MRKGRRSGSVLLLLATLTTTLLVGDVLGLAAQDPQPANPAQTPQTQPTETQTPKKSTSKKKSRQTKTTTPTGDQTTTPADPANPEQADPAQMPAQTEPAQTTAPAQTRTNMAAEQTDLSGTYAGTFTCDALGLTGDTTLTITGNQFTTADGKSGRIVASTTSGYTAVALQTGEVPTGAPAAGATTTPPTIVSLRARRSRNSLTLTPAAGSTTECRFIPTRGNVARGRRSRQRTPSATGTEVSNPAAMPNPTAPTEPTAPPTTPEQPLPSQTPSPSPTPSGSPTPMPSPTPSGTPNPEPEPSPTASPTPSPSPSPARPRG